MPLFDLVTRSDRVTTVAGDTSVCRGGDVHQTPTKQGRNQDIRGKTRTCLALECDHGRIRAARGAKIEQDRFL